MEENKLNEAQQMILKRFCQIVNLEYRQIEDRLIVNQALTKHKYIMAGIRALCLVYEAGKQLKKAGYQVNMNLIVSTVVRCVMLKMSRDMEGQK